MKVVILAGGLGTRISEESHLKPKPMIEIGGKPVLWHIMKIYSHFGFHDFIICLGYKGYIVKEYFSHYFLHEADVTFDFRNGNQEIVHNYRAEPWRVTLVNTGQDTMTGGRIRNVKPYLNGERFMLTYGDGVANVDLDQLLSHHISKNKIATLTTVQPSGRFGAIQVDDDNLVSSFQEKPQGDGAWINGGFFVLEPEIFDLLDNDTTIFEKEPLERLATSGQLTAYRHHGFWQPMDTLRDKQSLEAQWNNGAAPWKVWK